MTAAADVTPSLPQRISITTALIVTSVNAISNGRTMSDTTQSSQPTGDGALSASACVGCEVRLSPQETYACDTCAAGWMKDANFNMTGSDYGNL